MTTDHPYQLQRYSETEARWIGLEAHRTLEAAKQAGTRITRGVDQEQWLAIQGPEGLVQARYRPRQRMKWEPVNEQR